MAENSLDIERPLDLTNVLKRAEEHRLALEVYQSSAVLRECLWLLRDTFFSLRQILQLLGQAALYRLQSSQSRRPLKFPLPPRPVKRRV